MRTSKSRWYQNINLSVTKHRQRMGCDGCKEDTATEAFLGHCGNVLWICGKCFKRITQKVKSDEEVGRR